MYKKKISPAKAQRRKALPRFYRFSLRLCAFVGVTFYSFRSTVEDLNTFVQNRFIL